MLCAWEREVLALETSCHRVLDWRLVLAQVAWHWLEWRLDWVLLLLPHLQSKLECLQFKAVYQNWLASMLEWRSRRP